MPVSPVRFAALALLITACGPSASEESDASPEDLLGRSFVSSSATVDDEPHQLVDDPLSVRFGDDTDGTSVGWEAGCNHSWGEFEVRADRIEPHRSPDGIPAFGATEIGCQQRLHEQDEWLEEVFAEGPMWELDDDTLELRTDSAAFVLEETPRGEASAEGDGRSDAESAPDTRTIESDASSLAAVSVETRQDLLDTTEAVVTIEPTGGQDLLRTIDGVEFYAQTFEVVESFSGSLEPGSEYEVIRSVNKLSPEARERAREQAQDSGDDRELRFEGNDDGVTFSEGRRYILGLKDSDGFYGREAFYVVAKRSSYIPLDGTRSAEASATVAAPDDEAGALQRRWSGRSYDRVAGSIRQAVDAQRSDRS